MKQQSTSRTGNQAGDFYPMEFLARDSLKLQWINFFQITIVISMRKQVILSDKNLRKRSEEELCIVFWIGETSTFLISLL